jgi:hypothetical protein
MRRQGLFALYSIDWDGIDNDVVDIVRSVRKGMERSKLGQEDLQKLASAERVLPECARQA